MTARAKTNIASRVTARPAIRQSRRAAEESISAATLNVSRAAWSIVPPAMMPATPIKQIFAALQTTDSNACAVQMLNAVMDCSASLDPVLHAEPIIPERAENFAATGNAQKRARAIAEPAGSPVILQRAMNASRAHANAMAKLNAVNQRPTVEQTAASNVWIPPNATPMSPTPAMNRVNAFAERPTDLVPKVTASMVNVRPAAMQRTARLVYAPTPAVGFAIP